MLFYWPRQTGLWMKMLQHAAPHFRHPTIRAAAMTPTTVFGCIKLTSNGGRAAGVVRHVNSPCQGWAEDPNGRGNIEIGLWLAQAPRGSVHRRSFGACTRSSSWPVVSLSIVAWDNAVDGVPLDSLPCLRGPTVAGRERRNLQTWKVCSTLSSTKELHLKVPRSSHGRVLYNQVRPQSLQQGSSRPRNSSGLWSFGDPGSDQLDVTMSPNWLGGANNL